MTANKTMTAARKFVAAAREAGWKISSRENVVTITKALTKEGHSWEASRRQFVELDGQWYGILSILPHKGSIWGTDGSGVGGYSAMLHGLFTMNVSGVSDKTINAIYAAWDEVLDETTGEVMTF
jgi:hypothetical protein